MKKRKFLIGAQSLIVLFLFCNCNAQQENKKANLEEAKKAISESNTL